MSREQLHPLQAPTPTPPRTLPPCDNDSATPPPNVINCHHVTIYITSDSPQPVSTPALASPPTGTSGSTGLPGAATEHRCRVLLVRVLSPTCSQLWDQSSTSCMFAAPSPLSPSLHPNFADGAVTATSLPLHPPPPPPSLSTISTTNLQPLPPPPSHYRRHHHLRPCRHSLYHSAPARQHHHATAAATTHNHPPRLQRGFYRATAHHHTACSSHSASHLT